MKSAHLPASGRSRAVEDLPPADQAIVWPRAQVDVLTHGARFGTFVLAVPDRRLTMFIRKSPRTCASASGRTSVGRRLQPPGPSAGACSAGPHRPQDDPPRSRHRPSNSRSTSWTGCLPRVPVARDLRRMGGSGGSRSTAPLVVFVPPPRRRRVLRRLEETNPALTPVVE